MVALFVGLAAGVGVVRLILGLRAVRHYRKESRSVPDRNILELRDILQASLSYPGTIALVESDRLATPATIGWRKPAIILPTNWRSWSDAERRAVLAHEIAHIRRHDFLTWVAAQVALVLHFYHPLVHWLSGRLRLEQELAADAAAAALAGGQQAYLKTLAAMALRQADAPLAWPARTFLPTRGTFMRRIEMLRDTKLSTKGISGWWRYGTLAVLLTAGIVVAGLRAGAGPVETAAVNAAIEQSLLPASVAAAEQPLSLAYVPRDAAFVFALRPAALLARPEFANTPQGPQSKSALAQQLGIPADHFEQVTIACFELLGELNQLNPGAIILHVKEPGDGLAIVKHLFADTVEGVFDGLKYRKKPDGRAGYLAQPDGRVVVLSDSEEHLRRLLVAGKEGPAAAKWSSEWNQTAGVDVRLLMHTSSLPGIMARMLQQAPPNIQAMLSAFSPLWEKTSLASLGLTFGDKLEIASTIVCPSAEDAKQVAATFSAIVTLARNALSQGREAASRLADDGAALKALDAAESLLDSLRVDTQGEHVVVTATGAMNHLATPLAMLLPAVAGARDAARQTQSTNNLKQIALAFHNFHDIFNHFPPAQVYGQMYRRKEIKPSQHPHSWRVAILPLLNQAALYNEYKFDEPWDSPSNMKLLDKMPAVFRDPNDPENSTNASYFGLIGDATAFGDKKGTSIRGFPDGLSNSIIVVEAKRDIPWTKPEDIPYDADKPVPQLGGIYAAGFLAALGDGSVRLVPKTIDEKVLRWLITINDGNPLPAGTFELKPK